MTASTLLLFVVAAFVIGGLCRLLVAALLPPARDSQKRRPILDATALRSVKNLR